MINKCRYLLDWQCDVIEEKNDVYQYCITMVYEDGVDKKIRGLFENINEMNQAEEIEKAELYNGIYAIEEDVSAEEFFLYWLYEVKAPFISSNTLQSYKNCIVNYILPYMEKKNIFEIKQGDVDQIFLNAINISGSVTALLKTVVSTSFQYAKREHFMKYNPYEPVRVKYMIKRKSSIEVKEVDEPIKIEDIKCLIAKVKGTSIYLHILFAALMGLRISEINGLKYGDISFNRQTIEIRRQLGKARYDKDKVYLPKTVTKQEISLKSPSGYRSVDIPDLVMYAILQERIRYDKRKSRRKKTFQDQDYICCSSYGRPRGKTYHQKKFNELIRDNNLPYLTMHKLRGLYSTVLLKEGVSLVRVSRLLGHKKINITADFYTDFNILTGGFRPAFFDIEPYVKNSGAQDYSHVRTMDNFLELYL